MNRLLRAAPSWALGLFLLVVFIAALFIALDFPRRARLFPIFVISVGVVLILTEITIAMIWPPAKNADTGLDLKADDDYSFREALRAGAPIFAWTGALFAAIWLIGPTLAMPLWLLAFFLVMVRAPLPATVATVAGFAIITIGLFDYLLQVPWPSGEIPHVQEWAQAVLESWGI